MLGTKLNKNNKEVTKETFYLTAFIPNVSGEWLSFLPRFRNKNTIILKAQPSLDEAIEQVGKYLKGTLTKLSEDEWPRGVQMDGKKGCLATEVFENEPVVIYVMFLAVKKNERVVIHSFAEDHLTQIRYSPTKIAFYAINTSMVKNSPRERKVRAAKGRKVG